MDNLLDFLPALIFFWVIARALRGNKRRAQRQRPATPGRAAGREGGLSGFEELVRRLEEAAREAQEKAAPPTQPAATRPPALAPARPAPAPLEPRTSDFSFVGAIDEPLQTEEFHETHALQALRRPSESMPSRALSGPRDQIAEVASTARPHPLIDRLRTVASAREAILLKDILGPPRSRQRIQ